MNCKTVAVVLFCFLSAKVAGQNIQDLQNSIVKGKIVYGKYCLACHQIDGSGVPQLTPPLIKSVFVQGEKAMLIGIVLKGLKDTEVNGEMYDNPMPPFDLLTNEEIADLLTYVRNNFSNKASPIKKEEVDAIRKKK